MQRSVELRKDHEKDCGSQVITFLHTMKNVVGHS